LLARVDEDRGIGISCDPISNFKIVKLARNKDVNFTILDKTFMAFL